LSRLTPQTNMGASAEGTEMMTFLAPPFKWADAFSVVVKTPWEQHQSNSSGARDKRSAYSRFDNVFNAKRAPWDIRGIPFSKHGDGLALNHELSVLDLDGSLETTVDRVILEHVGLFFIGKEKGNHRVETGFEEGKGKRVSVRGKRTLRQLI
jgi:hypothetical protein